MSDMWPGTGSVSQVQIVPHLFSESGVGRDDPWGQEGELVTLWQTVYRI
jgi:hypothetical protein